MNEIQRLAAPGILDEAMAAPCAVIIRHLNADQLSEFALGQVTKFREVQPDVPIYRVNRYRDSAISEYLDSALDLPDESPQAVVISSGNRVWNGVHTDITLNALVKQALSCLTA